MLQVDDPPTEYVPAGHVVHLVEDIPEKVPAGHFVQTAERNKEYVPAGHVSQTSDKSPLEKVPALHGIQILFLYT